MTRPLIFCSSFGMVDFAENCKLEEEEKTEFIIKTKQISK